MWVSTFYIYMNNEYTYMYKYLNEIFLKWTRSRPCYAIRTDEILW